MRCALCVLAVSAVVGAQQATPAPAPGTKNPPQSLAMGAAKSRMTFFATSKGLGTAADLTDLARADAHCQALAKAESAGDHTWRAYLGARALDRIGKGPWYNAEAELVAANRDEVRAGGKLRSKDFALTERGDTVDGLDKMRQSGKFFCFGID